MSERMPVIVLGVGNVGRAFLKLLRENRAALAARYGIDLEPVALVDRWGAVFNPAGLSEQALDSAIAAKLNRQSLAEQPNALADTGDLALIEHAVAAGFERAVVVDATATGATDISSALHKALESGYGIAFANKRPLAGSWNESEVFFKHPLTRFEAAVSAGLPVVTTLHYLVNTGDTVQRIAGALSGTLGFLCSRLEDGETFSAAVADASAKGYTEPDPREDLSGIDVARKALILARLAGWPMELDDIDVKPLYPNDMAEMDEAEFVANLPRLDADFAAYMGAMDGVPRFMAEITPDKAEVGLRMVGERLAAQLRGTQNMVSFYTRRYPMVPLSLVGPGAGMEPTAAAVLQDCLELARDMG